VVTNDVPIYVAGGRQARAAGVADRSHRALYDRAVLARLDPDRMKLEPVLGYTSPPEACGGDPGAVGHRFGAPSRDGDTVVLCTEREVLRLGPAGLSAVSHPWLADVHHALSAEGRTWAVATALDGVVELPDGTFTPVTDPGIARDLPPGDLRAVELPRANAHPNHLFRVDGALWVTRGILGDAVRLGSDPRPDRCQRWVVAEGTVHDGVVAPDGVWFTAVDGRLLRVDPENGRVSRTVDLRAADDGPEPLGWCRGLVLVDGVAFVGFTRLRATRWRERLAWVRGGLRGRAVATRRPTRVDAFELATGRRIGSVHGAEVELDAIFGLV
jgi:hypothetical protein